MNGGELTDVDVKFISLVKKGANGKKVSIFKSADYVDPDTKTGEEAGAPEAPVDNPEVSTEEVSREEASIVKSFLGQMKKLFGGQMTDLSKSADLDNQMDYTSFSSRMSNPEYTFDRAMDALRGSVWDIFWDSDIPNGKELILKNIDDFRSYIDEKLNTNQVIQKSFFTKSDNNSVEGGDEMKLEDISKSLAEVTASVSAIAARVEKMEANAPAETPAETPTETPAETPTETPAETPTETPAETPTETPAETPVEDPVAAAITKSMAVIQKSLEGIESRLTTVENVRGLSNGSGETVSKSTQDEWNGVLDF